MSLRTRRILITFTTLLVAAGATIAVLASMQPKATSTTTTPDPIAAVEVQTTGTYVSLGDSGAAGDGLARTSSISDECRRSGYGYPSLVAEELSMQLIPLSCNSASMGYGVLNKQNSGNKAVRPQVDRLLEQPSVDLVTLTIGANDIGWSSLASRCYATTCGTADEPAINEKLTTLSKNLSTLFGAIETKYGSDTQVVITGLYQIFPSSLINCPALSGISSAELAWVRKQDDRLNATIQAAAQKYSFVAYAPIDFTGHELCTDETWLQSPTDASPLHANKAGHEAIAKSILTQTRR